MGTKQKKEILLKDKRYTKVYLKTWQELKVMGIKDSLPGFILLIQANCISRILRTTEEETLALLEQVTLVPSTTAHHKKGIKRISAAEQWMVEALRASGYEEEPFDFLKKIQI